MIKKRHTWTNKNSESSHQKIITKGLLRCFLKKEGDIAEGSTKMQWEMKNKTFGKYIGKYKQYSLYKNTKIKD
jgi:hypothetical protein